MLLLYYIHYFGAKFLLLSGGVKHIIATTETKLLIPLIGRGQLHSPAPPSKSKSTDETHTKI